MLLSSRSDLTVHDAKVSKVCFSDHYPLAVDFVRRTAGGNGKAGRVASLRDIASWQAWRAQLRWLLMLLFMLLISPLLLPCLLLAWVIGVQ